MRRLLWYLELGEIPSCCQNGGKCSANRRAIFGMLLDIQSTLVHRSPITISHITKLAASSHASTKNRYIDVEDVLRIKAQCECNYFYFF